MTLISVSSAVRRATLPISVLALWPRVVLVFVLAFVTAGAARAEEPLRIGSKRFTESYILAQVLAQQAAPQRVEVRQGLGNTAITFAALQSGSIDLYPEYTGTIALEILKSAEPLSLEAMNAKLAPMGLGAAIPLGFNDGYALAMRDDVAGRLGITRLSDLARHPMVRLGLSNEFIGRADGWKALARAYALPQQPAGLDHGLAYDALAGGQVDVIDIYTTDAKIKHLGLRVLQDDARFFPRYDAVVLYRLDVPARFPEAWATLQRLAGRIDEPTMIAMNARAELDGVAFDVIARDHLAGRSAAPGAAGGFWQRLVGPDLMRLTLQHLGLVFGAVAIAVLVGVPLATAVAGHARARAVVLGVTGLLQTVPSIAMLAVLITLVGRIGAVPALVALTLYALLPIMRNTCTGLAEVPDGLKAAARSLGLTRVQSLRFVELPLAAPVIVAGVRTATTIAVGTATIAAFIGAGGYGERIVTGLALNDQALLLAGALPAAVLALLCEAAFAAVERRLDRGRGR
jgi:osmoprotectant transport system permease protein